MKYITYVSSPQDLRRCVAVEEITEVLIEPALLACEGRLSKGQTFTLAEEARSLGLEPVLVWDSLKTEHQIDALLEELKKWNLAAFSAVRIRDIGAAQWLVENHPDSSLHLIAETGNHNLQALHGWCELFQENIARILLSIELPEEKLIEYCQKITVPVEVLAAGRIRLFYSPRRLLSDNFQHDGQDYVEVVSASEDSHGRPFPTVESAHGTYMYLDKDQFILDRIEGLQKAGLHSARIDLRHLSAAGESCSGIDILCKQLRVDPSAARKEWPHPTLAPFFKTNKTTAQFGRLKSSLHNKRDKSCLAQVVATEKGRSVAYFVLEGFSPNDTFAAVLPTGEEVCLPKVQFRGIEGMPVQECRESTVVTSKWIAKLTPGTLIRRVQYPG